jgi:hypothetical protein
MVTLALIRTGPIDPITGQATGEIWNKCSGCEKKTWYKIIRIQKNLNDHEEFAVCPDCDISLKEICRLRGFRYHVLEERLFVQPVSQKHRYDIDGAWFAEQPNPKKADKINTNKSVQDLNKVIKD